MVGVNPNGFGLPACQGDPGGVFVHRRHYPLVMAYAIGMRGG